MVKSCSHADEQGREDATYDLLGGGNDDEGLKREALDKILANYLFTEKTPMRDDVIGVMKNRPALRDRRSVADRVIEKIKAFVETFIEGVD